MADYGIPKSGVAYVFYGCLVSQADTKLFKSAPTLAAGDFKVSIDGGAFANLATLPTNTPGTFAVKFSLSSSEMTGDNILVVASDAAGAEWCDQCWNIQTSPRGIADLAYPTVSGRSLDVSAGGEAGVDWANIGSPTTAVNLSATNIDVDQVVASVSGATGSVTAGVTVTTNNDKTGYGLSATAVQAIWDALTTALTTVGSIGKKLADWTIGTAQTGDSFARLGAPAGASVSADIVAMKAETASILTDTAEIGVAGAGLTALASAANLATVAGYIDTEIATLQTSVNDLPTNAELATALDALPTAAENATAVLTTAMTESYRADGATGTLAQAQYEILAHLGESSIVSTTKTIKKVDGTTTAATFTLDSDTAPTSITRAT